MTYMGSPVTKTAAACGWGGRGSVTRTRPHAMLPDIESMLQIENEKEM